MRGNSRRDSAIGRGASVDCGHVNDLVHGGMR